MAKQPAVYLLASDRNGTLYTGVTSNLVQRIGQHRNNIEPGYTHQYGVHPACGNGMDEDRGYDKGLLMTKEG